MHFPLLEMLDTSLFVPAYLVTLICPSELLAWVHLHFGFWVYLIRTLVAGSDTVIIYLMLYRLCGPRGGGCIATCRCHCSLSTTKLDYCGGIVLVITGLLYTRISALSCIFFSFLPSFLPPFCCGLSWCYGGQRECLSVVDFRWKQSIAIPATPKSLDGSQRPWVESRLSLLERTVSAIVHSLTA